MRYAIKRDPGYNNNNLLVINKIGFGGIFKNKIKVLKQELLNHPNVTNVGLSDIQPSEQTTQNYMFTHLGRPEDIHLIARTGVGYDYFSTYQIPITAGRNYSEERDVPEPEVDFMTISLGDNKSKPLEERNIIINESAARKLGYANAAESIGKVINSTTVSNTNYTIIGVTADNHMFSINAPPRAEVYLLEPDFSDIVTVRFNGPIPIRSENK